MATCVKCGDTGWITTEKDGVPYAIRCDCFRRNYLQQLIEQARIPPRYKHCQLNNYEAGNASQKEAQDVAFEFAKNFPHGDRGILFLGPCGVGKTHLAVGILHELAGGNGVRCRFFDFRELLQALRDSYDPNNPVREREIIAEAVGVQVLLLDDLGAEKLSGWVLERLNYVINNRYSRGLVTLITTNYLEKAGRGDETLSERIGVRLRSRLHEMCRTVLIEGQDYRKVLGQRKANFGV